MAGTHDAELNGVGDRDHRPRPRGFRSGPWRRRRRRGTSWWHIRRPTAGVILPPLDRITQDLPSQRYLGRLLVRLSSPVFGLQVGVELADTAAIGLADGELIGVHPHIK